jgi:hypothetical protein
VLRPSGDTTKKALAQCQGPSIRRSKCFAYFAGELPGAGELGLDELDAPSVLLDGLLPAELPAPVRPAPDMSLEELLELWVSLVLLPLRAAPSHFAYSCGVR